MGMMDKYRKRAEEKEKDAATPPPHGLTFAEIKQDREKSHLFLLLLKQNGHKDLATRIAERKVAGAADVQLIEKQRKIFAEKMVQSEKVEKFLTKENMVSLARNHPNFEAIVNAGSEQAIRAIKNHLREISITDESKFNAVVESLKIHDDYENGGEYKELDQRVDKLCKDNGITSQEYFDALDTQDPIEKKKALQKLASKSYGEFRKALDWISGGSLSEGTLKSLQNSQDSMENQIEELNKRKGDIGSALFLTITSDKAEAMLNAVYNEESPEKPKSGFLDAQKDSTLDEVQLQKEWKAKKAMMGHANYNQLNKTERDVVKEQFLKEQDEKYEKKNKGKGGWHDFFAAVIKSLLDLYDKDKLE